MARVQTPAFMPVGTQATVKGLAPEDVRATGAEIVLGNTYHLMLRPGAERIAALGGLHKFMNWPLPILTDSGGFQVMSLSDLRKLTEQGVTFRSHLDGAMVELSPERAIEIQALLGADISMQLDECLKLPAARDEIARAMQLSLRWAERSKRAFEGRAREGYALFGIVQGGDDLALRGESARALTDIGFDGYAIGGLAVGEPQEVMLKIVAETAPMLPADRPRYLMGVGTPHDLLEAVARGIDMFDCVLPTRNGRHGMAFTRFGSINLSNARHANDPRPLDEQSAHPAARTYSRAYLHHLTKANEILGQVLLSTINLAYYQELMAGMREAIAAGRFAEFRAATMAQWAAGRYCLPLSGVVACTAWLKPAHERPTCLPRQAPQAALQAAAGQLRRPLPRVRAGRQVSLCAEPALHAGRRAEGNAGGAARHLGIDRAVIVQASCHGTDNAAMLDCIASDPKRYRGVAIVDDSFTDADYDKLDRGGVRGVRFNFVKHLGGAPDMAVFNRVIDRIKGRGWHVVLHLDAPDIVPLSDMIRQAAAAVRDRPYGAGAVGGRRRSAAVARFDRAFAAGKLLDQGVRLRAHFHAALCGGGADCPRAGRSGARRACCGAPISRIRMPPTRPTRPIWSIWCRNLRPRRWRKSACWWTIRRGFMVSTNKKKSDATSMED